jgi:hypothetical protein
MKGLTSPMGYQICQEREYTETFKAIKAIYVEHAKTLKDELEEAENLRNLKSATLPEKDGGDEQKKDSGKEKENKAEVLAKAAEEMNLKVETAKNEARSKFICEMKKCILELIYTNHMLSVRLFPYSNNTESIGEFFGKRTEAFFAFAEIKSNKTLVTSLKQEYLVGAEQFELAMGDKDVAKNAYVGTNFGSNISEIPAKAQAVVNIPTIIEDMVTMEAMCIQDSLEASKKPQAKIFFDRNTFFAGIALLIAQAGFIAKTANTDKLRYLSYSITGGAFVAKLSMHFLTSASSTPLNIENYKEKFVDELGQTIVGGEKGKGSFVNIVKEFVNALPINDLMKHVAALEENNKVSARLTKELGVDAKAHLNGSFHFV